MSKSKEFVNTESEPQYKLWTLVNRDASVLVHQL